jgi:predicted DNA-binding transcriptional regulator YafY
MSKEHLTYFTLVRLAAIRRKLVSGVPVNVPAVAAELECSQKTIYRDIEFLRSRFGYVMEYDPNSHGWVGRVPAEAIL